MELIYNLDTPVVARCSNKQLGVVGSNEISIILNCALYEDAQFFITAHLAGHNVVSNVEVKGGIYVVPNDLIKEGKLMMRVEAVADGAVVKSWLLEPIELIGAGQMIEATLLALPDIESIRSTVISMADNVASIDRSVLSISSEVDRLIEANATKDVAMALLEEHGANKDVAIEQLTVMCSDYAVRLTKLEAMLDDPSIIGG